MLSEVDRDTKNVLSLEDPVEYNMEGVNQSQVHPEIGYTFATGLRTTLRQDPDVIMVGEIRDKETAQLAIQAAQTGHLVLSTLHTRNAIGALSRLKSLGIDQESVESCLRCVSSQRLVRKRCGQCHQTPKKSTCQLCKGSGYFGRIGVHEVLGNQQLLESTQQLNLYSAGMQSVKAGLIDQHSLDSELGTWH
jgi:type II secretory ATPase GspE/PulE/Tfp pilus assembly ATPase PilB-like protein